jgi:mono/diheme cytochrome c family protein
MRMRVVELSRIATAAPRSTEGICSWRAAVVSAVAVAMVVARLAAATGSLRAAEPATPDQPAPLAPIAASAQSARADDRPAADLTGHRQIVEPFFRQYCQRCHGADKQLAGLALHQLGGDLVSAAPAVGEKWRAVLQRLRTGEMPPEDEPQPQPAEVKAVLEWIARELDKSRRAALQGRDEDRGSQPPPLEPPTHGNYVDHDAVFRCEEGTSPGVSGRLWRIRPEIYEQWVAEFTKNRLSIAQPFARSGGEFSDLAAGATVDEPTAGQLLRNAQAIVAYQTGYTVENGQIRGDSGSVKEFLALLDPQQPPTDEQIQRAIGRQFQLALKRDPTDDELRRFTSLMRRNIEDAGQVVGVRTTLAAVLLLPEAVFRFELGAAPTTPAAAARAAPDRPEDPARAGLVRLAPREIAFALAYALTDRRPDPALLTAAAQGKLDTRDGVAQQVQRLWDDAKLPKTRILRFFREYFGYAAAIDVFKDAKDFTEHDARILVADTDRLVEFILAEDRHVLYELLTTTRSFVNYTVDPKQGPKPATDKKKVQLSYNLPEDWRWTASQPVELPSSQRSGILTQPSWLVAHSTNTENHAILRGKWVRERLLGGTIPDLPITVDAQLPDDPHQTLRQRMQVTQQEYCWQCHRRMNPLGLPFEMYDHFGRYRTTELDQPVDASGSIDRSGDPALDGAVGNAIEMLHKLARSPRVEQVFVRHAFRYFLGRNETPGDACSLVEAYRAYRENDGSFRALVVSLLTSDSFLYRREQPAEP